MRLKQEVGSAFHTRLMNDFKKICDQWGPRILLRGQQLTYAVGITDNSGDCKAFSKEAFLPGGQTLTLNDLYYLEIKGKEAFDKDLTLYVVWWQRRWTKLS